MKGRAHTVYWNGAVIAAANWVLSSWGLLELQLPARLALAHMKVKDLRYPVSFFFFPISVSTGKFSSSLSLPQLGPDLSLHQRMSLGTVFCLFWNEALCSSFLERSKVEV